MGCNQSVPQQAPTRIKIEKRLTTHNFGRKEGLNKADYIFSKRSNETLIKEPRDIDGEQFIIEESENCNMFLLDHMGMLTIDYCNNCRIVSGPVASSVFIRNCNNCVIVIACQQLRLRDCKNLTIFLHSTTGPIIESSTSISFGCYNYAYFGFEEHLIHAEMSIWNNDWYSVYDFTPDGGGNHRLLKSGEESTLIEKVVPASTALIEDGLCTSPQEGRITPLLYGPLEGTRKSVLYIFRPRYGQFFRKAIETYVKKNVESADEANKLVVLRTVERKVSSSQLNTLLGGDKKAVVDFTTVVGNTDQGSTFDLVALELSFAHSTDEEAGRAVAEQFHATIQESREIVKGATFDVSKSFKRWISEEADEKANLIFEQWRVKT